MQTHRESAPSVRRMRHVAGHYIADDPQAWSWAIDAVREHVLAAEATSAGRFLKARLFRALGSGLTLRCLPALPAHSLQAELGLPSGEYQMIFRRSHNKWIAVSRSGQTLTRRFPTRWRWQRERWIRGHQTVAQLAPPMLGWDEARLLSHERYIPGRPVRVHDLEEGLTAWHEIWPHMGELFLSRSQTKALRGGKRMARLFGRTWDYLSTDLGPLEEAVRSQPVTYGLIHGDLQQSNMLFSRDRFYVIDWGDHFHMEPPLYDLLFYFFKHARALGARKVAEAAFADPKWIEDGLPGSLSPLSVRASLLAFTYMLLKRYQYRKARRRAKLAAEVRSYVRAVCERLLPFD